LQAGYKQEEQNENIKYKSQALKKALYLDRDQHIGLSKIYVVKGTTLDAVYYIYIPKYISLKFKREEW